MDGLGFTPHSTCCEQRHGIFPMKPNVRPETKEVTPIHAVIASSRRIAVPSVKTPVLTRNFQLGIDQTHTRLHSSASNKKITAMARTTPPGVPNPGLLPNTVRTTKLPVMRDENHVWNALLSRSHSTTKGRFSSSMIARESVLISDMAISIYGAQRTRSAAGAAR